ncbi:hypothetical protein PBCVNY2B_556R [Paramecium bursaria Chlorella virus NY2B]|uniref:Uncharacterized protein n=1 Tax=Paramecium bursaria Chlorella virus NYs1 TaxID=83442 RepID=M1I3D7_9PHYC|nr:hypothetical protein FK949_gp343 [Paramecium bursaria Chlorella virus NYs1]AGE54923.1 hypothetical protein PBCVMA1D_441R [Paramecium bursaria Chlorella virus MA1D]AGE58398.1 hypothetical protein PBCVNY2B_556R [Paramecium bursaria Chlorella virus NY2B]AGE58782.1 hypothetical protein PBCVNYs1_568R [Paramecium bursaria Chlorella virus NYs1]
MRGASNVAALSPRPESAAIANLSEKESEIIRAATENKKNTMANLSMLPSTGT